MYTGGPLNRQLNYTSGYTVLLLQFATEQIDLVIVANSSVSDRIDDTTRWGDRRTTLPARRFCCSSVCIGYGYPTAG